METTQRIHEAAIRKINEEERTVEFIASDATPDSYDTVIPVLAWNLERFQKNGVIGYQHDVYSKTDPDNVIGVGEAFVDDDKLIVRVKFEPADLNEKADKIYRKIQFGSLKAVSVGFEYKRGHWGEEKHGEDKNLYYFDEVILLEVSIVNIPSNPNALKRELSSEEQSFRGRKPQEQEDESGKDKDVKVQEENRNFLTIAKARLALANKKQ